MSDPARGAEAEDAYGFPAGLWRWLQRHPPPALHRLTRFRSPLRGPWLTSVFGLVLLVALPFVIITGLLSYIAYAPQLGQAIPGDVGWLRLPAFTWPTRPSWLYRLTQGLHVGLGLVIIPVVLAKLWSVIPRLFVWPPARSIAQVLERLSVLMLVGGILFQIVTGVLNIQYDYIFGFSFYTGHYFGAWVFIAGFLLHIVVKIPHMVTGLRSIPMREVLGTNVADTRAQPCDPDGLVSVNPGEATLSRRGALGLVGAGVLLIGVLTVGPARLGLRPVHGSRWLFGNLLGDWFRRRLWGSFANLDSPVSRRRLARVRVRAGVVMVVTNDRNLTGQLGDRDGVTIAASPPAPSGRGAGDPLPGQQLGHRDLPVTGALCFGVWSRHGLLPLDRLAAFRSAG